MEEKPTQELDSKYLRTLLRSDVYDRLEEYAKSLKTGYDKWDFGVAIERLLDTMDLNYIINDHELRLHDLETKEDSMNIPAPELVQVSKESSDSDLNLLGSFHNKEINKVRIENKEDI